jgi:diguanylate cyclase (GGDEF)-like protein/PAS domain S-box-containing protein
MSGVDPRAALTAQLPLTTASSAAGPPPSDVQGRWLRLAVGAMGRGVMVTDADGRIVFTNEAAHAMHRMTGAELAARTAFDPRWRTVRVDGTPLTADELPAARCLATSEAVTDEVIGVHDAVGHLRWHRVDSRPLLDAGVLVGAVVTFDDVTETVQMREELDRSRQQLAEARRAGRVGLWEWHADTGEVWHDGHFELIVGRACAASPAEWLAVVHPDDTAMVRRAFTRLRQGEPYDLTYRIGHDDGTERWVISHAEVTCADDQGRPTRVAGSVVDITEAQHTTVELRALLDSMADGYVTTDADGTYRIVNRRAAELLQRTDLVGRNIWQEFPGLYEVVGEMFHDVLTGATVEVEMYYEGLEAWYEIRGHPLGGGVALCFRDVTERRKVVQERERLLDEAARARDRLAHAALHDDLTDLPNRTALLSWLSAHVGANARAGQVGLLYLDLDRFKLVNDTYGHSTGDGLLVQAARRLESVVRPTDSIARLGGDEFVIAVADTTAADLDAMARRVVQIFREPFTVGDRRLVVTTSVGVALGEPDVTPGSLLSDADAALYRAKDAGRDQLAAFDDSLRAAAWQRLATEADLRDALTRPATAIQAHYQPIYDLASGDMVGAEALARWAHPQRGLLAPSQFIPVAEDTGLVVDLGWLMFDHAALAFETLAGGFGPQAGRVWVNVAARQLDEPRFAEHLMSWAEDRGAVGRIGLEITESALTRDGRGAESTIRTLADHGFAIAIDDFGTGYSSLFRLAQFPVDLLKIDRSFVADLASGTGRGIVASIVSLAHSIGAAACAEGVETAEQLAALTELGVDRVSGLHLCHPLPLDAVTDAAQLGGRRIHSPSGPA